jgi:hypothetical protein
MKLTWFSAALSTVLMSGVCAHAQEAGVFDKWLNERSPTCVPVSEFKTVSTVIELTPNSSSSCALYVVLPPVSRTSPAGDKGHHGEVRRRRHEAVAGMAVYTAWAILHGKGGDVLGDARGEHPLTPSDETEIARPVFSEENDNV